MIVSFTLPTRNRIPQLSNVLNSIYNTCYDVNNFEILLAIDNDDYLPILTLNYLYFKDNDIKECMYIKIL